MIRSFSVIVPVRNKENEIIRTLNSIEASIAYFYQHSGASNSVAAEVVVVDEESSDRTVELVTEFKQDKPHYQLIHHFKSLGAGPARNTGVRMSKGEILFFCDGDDLFFPPHIDLCIQLLNYYPSPGSTQSAFAIIQDTSISLPPYRLAAVRTGVHMQEQIHPYWKMAIENTLPQNLCVRRECHEFIEGFPENSVYQQIGCEDISYTVCLSKFFRVFKIDMETVEYIRYPGNNFDRQLTKFQTPPEQYQNDIPASEKELHIIRINLEQEKQRYLLDKLRRIDKNPELLSLLNWQSLGQDYLEQRHYIDAISLWEQGIQSEPDATEAVKNLLAAAYNNFGSILQKQGNFEQAEQYFKNALKLKPSFSLADFAKVYYNLAITLKEQRKATEALQFLHQSRESDPTIAETISEFSRVQYQLQVLAKGYQFTCTEFGKSVAIWEQHLKQFAAMPNLRVLDVGGGDGCAACWLLDNVLTHASAQITCINRLEITAQNQDSIHLEVRQPDEDGFGANLAKTNCPQKARTIVGNPQMILRSLISNSYDLLYIHHAFSASDVLEIILLSWGLLKVGGMMILDHDEFNSSQKTTGKLSNVAIDAFLNIFNNKIHQVHQGDQVFLQKITD
jgi:glycosyltransferase involved in cell wall biosynthesis/predicted O-methyltransferase YrrM